MATRESRPIALWKCRRALAPRLSLPTPGGWRPLRYATLHNLAGAAQRQGPRSRQGRRSMRGIPGLAQPEWPSHSITWQINRGCSSCRVAFCKSSPCNDRNRTDWDHRPGITSLCARLATTEPSMNPRGGSLAGRLLDRCITAELALNWPPDRAVELPCWTPAGPPLEPRWPPPLEPRWSPAGPPLDPRWTVADDVTRPRPSSRSSRASRDEGRAQDHV